MAETAVSLLLPKLVRIVEHEMQFFSKEFPELANVRSELERMQAFLKTADAHEETDEEVKVWVKQIRDLAMETEDIVDELANIKEHKHGNDISNFNFIDKLSRFVKQWKARWRVMSDIKAIHQRLKGISEEFPRLRKKLSTPFYRNETFVDESSLVGIFKVKETLVDLLINQDSRRQVVAVTGMPGIGKSTLTKQVHDDNRVKMHFPLHAWITVSQNYHMEELLDDIFLQLFSAELMPEDRRRRRGPKLKEKINELLKSKRYLVVLDDVWSSDVWEQIGVAFPINDCGSRVVITTRDNDVAKSACSCLEKIYPMKPLDEKESWTLFCNKTFRSNACPAHLEDICKRILTKCEGLPLAIVAISGVLARKDERRRDEWEMILRALGAEIEDNKELQNLRRVLSLSYRELPHFLRPCFLYLSMFPEDHNISRMKLIRLWVAEGFAEPKTGKEPEDVADEYFRELVSRNLLQVTETTDGRIKFCRLHDFLREVVKSLARDQNFAGIARASTRPWPDRVQRLSLHSLRQSMPQIISNAKLRCLIIFGEEVGLQSVLPSCDLRLLTVLDLPGLPIRSIPKQVNDLVNLRYLGLKRTKIESVPRCIGFLRCLETLNLKHTFVTELPADIFKLAKLRHLLLYRYEDEFFAVFNSKHGFKVSRGIGNLQYLQKLCFIELDHGNDNDIIGELRQLTQLRRLGILKVKEEDGKRLCNCLENLQDLRALSLLTEEEEEVLDLNELEFPPQLLQRLYLSGRMKKLPAWIPNLGSLIRLHLKWSRLQEDPLNLIQFLPNLMHFELLQAYEGERLIFRAGGFGKLKHLCIDNFDDLRSIEVEEGAMSGLEKMYILRCKLLRTVPTGIEHLKKLRELRLFAMNDELVNSLSKDVEDSDFWRVSSITEVYLMHCENDDGRSPPLCMDVKLLWTLRYSNLA